MEPLRTSSATVIRPDGRSEKLGVVLERDGAMTLSTGEAFTVTAVSRRGRTWTLTDSSGGYWQIKKGCGCRG